MTVIAWDGQVLAADSLATAGSACSTVCKIFAHEDCLLGITGDLSVGMELLNWFQRDRTVAGWRQEWRNPTEGASLLVIYPDGSAWKYESSPYPFQLLQSFPAIGSGAEIAMAVMDAGRNAHDAVELTCKYNNTCGGPVMCLSLPTPAFNAEVMPQSI